jgi:DNA-binding MurR/RpiR family transcriptional regulator
MTPGRADPLQRLREALPRLRNASRRVAELILADPERAAQSSITRLAAAAETTPATVTRLATGLGFEGFPALRAAIAVENGRAAQSGWERDIGTAIQPEDGADQVLNVLAGVEVQALRNSLTSVDRDAAVRLAEAIAAASRVHIYSDWGDSISARELYLRLLRIGVPVWYCEGSNSARAITPLLDTGDVVLAVSRSGADPLGRAFLTAGAERGALTAVITGEPDSDIAGCSDVVLYTGTRNGRMWTEYFAGRASDVLVAGLLFVLVAQRMPAQPQPSGSDELHLADGALFSEHQQPTGDENR